MYFNSMVYTIHLYASDVKSAHTQYTHTLSVSFGDVKSLALEEKVEGIVKVLSKYESYDHIGIFCFTYFIPPIHLSWFV